MRQGRLLPSLLALALLVGCASGEVPQSDLDKGMEASVQERPYTAETLPVTADLTHDGTPEQLGLRTFPMEDAGPPLCMVYELRVLGEGDAVLWSEQATDVHPGWNALFLCPVEGKDYLLRYRPAMYQGSCNYSYQIFSLDSQGNEVLYKEDAIDFDLNFHREGLDHSFSPVEIAVFLDTVNGYLEKSTVLLNTDEALQFKEGQPPQDTLWWLHEAEFSYDESTSLLENLQALQTWKREQETKYEPAYAK